MVSLIISLTNSLSAGHLQNFVSSLPSSVGLTNLKGDDEIQSFSWKNHFPREYSKTEISLEEFLCYRSVFQ